MNKYNRAGLRECFLIVVIPAICLFLYAVSIAGAGEKQTLTKQMKTLQKEELLDEILLTMDSKYAAIQSLEVSFEQTKTMVLLAQPITSTGVLLFIRPGSLLWRFSNPDPTVMSVTGDQMIIHYPDINQADIFEIGKYKERVAKYLGFSDSMMKLKRYYDIRIVEEGADAWFLELIPKRRRIKQKIDLLELWLDRTSYLPVKINYREPNGDTTQVKILKTVTNPDLGPDQFKYTLPEGTKLNYPMKENRSHQTDTRDDD